MRKTYLLTVPQVWVCCLTLGLVILLAACGDTGATTPTGSTSATTPGSTATSASTNTNPSTNPGTAPSSAPTAASTSAPLTPANNIAIVGFAFSKKTLTVKVGTKITWTNDDPSIHTVTADNGAFGSSPLAPGGTFSFTFTKAGTYSYHCKLHATMKATIVVQ
ncbi:MAG TPA: plastocyanin/azurin family copper-binding protein [Ktedonobacteraceae bacterium]|nr:plastocyanin/azurin family copper-binding protein [Ktedonobacteraceae bacterium]